MADSTLRCGFGRIRRVDWGAMKRLLVPATIGVNAARHLAWYVSYQVSGSARI